MLRKIFIAVVALILVFVVLVATRPADFRVSRSATISAAPAAVFDEVNDLHKWQSWSPWAKLDPEAKVTYDGPESGQGASFHWAGNSQVGEGTMTLVESQPNESVRFKIEFMKPFAGTNDAVFTFKPAGDQTEVTWTMTGKNGFLGKAFSLFVDCDKMVGRQFEEGFTNLKGVLAIASQP
jgi:polyketide cyclase/dehydrase/lipid transport protein